MYKSSSPKILLILLAAVLIFIAGFFTDRYYLASKGSSTYRVNGTLLTEREEVNVDLLWEVWDALEENHIDGDNIDGQEMLYSAAKGLAEGVGDGYTSFLTPEEKELYESFNKREFQGIGTTLAEDNDFVIIETPVSGSPAEKAGLKPKDIIMEVDGQKMQGKSVTEVAELIRGDKGTKVTITYLRPETAETKSVTIVRDLIDLENITVEELADGLVMLHIYQFTEADVNTFNAEWDRNIAKIISKNPKGIVIDLRNNPGGFVESTRYALADFLAEGEIAFKEENNRGKITEYKINRVGKLLDIPIVVIVNEGSASAAEIFASALQDHGRAEIIGAETVGKGVEQKLIDLSDGSMLQVVFQKWLTPNGRNINIDEPVEPDHLVEDPDDQEAKAIELLNQ